MNSIPLMLVGDHPSLDTGLARIGRDLATLLSSNPRFRVAYCGYGGIGARRLPFHCYNMQGTIEYFTWPRSVMESWRDWSNDEPGILFTVWDLSRLLWLAQPQHLQDELLANWVKGRNFKIWSYLPIDSSGPGNKQTIMTAQTMLGVDRLLAMSPFGLQQVVATIGQAEADRRGATYLPHGLGQTWQPGSPKDKQKRIGVVASNQPRKDWGMVAQIAAALPEVRFWFHVDEQVRAWSIPALLSDYELYDRVEVTTRLSDAQLAACYQVCDLTIAPGLGEGFGYPIFESLACGAPVVAIDYAGAASILSTLNLPYNWKIHPRWYRFEGQHNSSRPVTWSASWVEVINDILDSPPDPLLLTKSIDHLRWKNLGHIWNRWFNEGVAC